ncbi:MAG: FMN-binding protein [Gammaproteobacteria bacterium]|nr:FMN-binding protein [Gammaproteobacteria bacterium]NVK88057.1 FMN-binding protein [Gammaproteobacteria bacterium]
MKKFFICLTFFCANLFALEDVYLQPQQFIQQQFDNPPKPQYFWITAPHKEALTKILGHKPRKLRIKYWATPEKSAWILEEIGKEHPITTGFSISAGKIQQVKVLIYRESRGYEVRQDFFTEQYIGAQLDKSLDLDQTIDGITGATLSVRALNKMAKVALYLDKQLQLEEVHEQKTAAAKP